MATGQQFHKSSLLGTLAYMGSPASALRNEAASKGMSGGSLFSRDVKPLSVDATTANAGDASTTLTGANADLDARAAWEAANNQTGPGSANSAIGFKDITQNNTNNDEGVPVFHTTTKIDNEVPPPTNNNNPPPPGDNNNPRTGEDDNTPKREIVTVTNDTNRRDETTVTTKVTNEVNRQINQFEAQGHGDPHYTAFGTTYTHKGETGDTYLLAAGNDVTAVGLYALNGEWSINVIAAVELQIARDPEEGRNHEIRVGYDLNHRDSVTITRIDEDGKETATTYSRTQLQNNPALSQIAPGYSLSWVSGGGIKLDTPTGTGTGQGSYVVDGGDWRHLAVSVQGNFTNQTGLLPWLGEKSVDPGSGRSDYNVRIAERNGQWGEAQIASKYNLNTLAGGAFADRTLDMRVLRGWGGN